MIPWTSFWDHNYFVQLVPGITGVLRSNYVRGAITGLGLVNLWAALAELADLVSQRHEDPPSGISIRHDG